MFSCKHAACFQNTFSQGHLWRAASVLKHFLLDFTTFVMLGNDNKKFGKEMFISGQRINLAKGNNPFRKILVQSQQ